MKLAFVLRFEGMNTLTHFSRALSVCARAHVRLCVRDGPRRQTARAKLRPAVGQMCPDAAAYPTDCDRMRSALQLNPRGEAALVFLSSCA